MTEKRKYIRKVFTALIVLGATLASATAIAQENCWCVEGYWVCDQSESQTTSQPYITYSEPEQSAATWYPPPSSYEPSYVTVRMSPAEIPPEAVAGLALIVLLMIGLALCDSSSNTLAQDTEAAVDEAAAAAAAKARLDEATREADEIIGRYRKQEFDRGRRS